jgi:Protein of unknown function (DUF3558)
MAAAVAAGCSSGGGSATPSPSAAARVPVGSPSAANACSLLTPDEIESVTGFAVKDGVLQTNDATSDCHWDSQVADTDTVGLTIQPYDDELWQTMSSSSHAVTVSGIGDAAFKGFPHVGDLTIKANGYEIDIAVIAGTQQPAQEDMETLALGQLVVPRL